MSAVTSAMAASLRLRVGVVAIDPVTAKQLAELVDAAGHEVVAAFDVADAILTDGSPVLLGSPLVAIGALEGDYAGLLPEEAGPVQVDAALRAVAAGLTVRPQELHELHEEGFGPLPEGSAPLLTPREVEVLGALANGLSNKAAALRLGISPHTVKFHVEQLFRKLGAGCRAEAVAKGLKRQIVEF
jgi:DNA-binding CsgD family transcriptional regulator